MQVVLEKRPLNVVVVAVAVAVEVAVAVFS